MKSGAGARPRALALIGPTASGKSALAMALAKRFNGEIVSIDSAQVYRGMDIGTAKPTPAERAAVPHHLIDLIDPTESYSAARFRDDAIAAVAAIHARGRLPILAGGTMLYLKALREGLDDLPRADVQTRQAIECEAAERGWPALHARLKEIDPATAARLAPTDAQRVGRALEIYRLTGSPMSSLLGERKAHGELPFELLVVALDVADRAELHRRIALRFEAMLAAGLEDEVRDLRQRHPALSAGMPSMRCVGYRQVWEAQDGRLPARELRERGIHATRQLAKRQLTWMRSLSDLRRFDFDRADLFDAVVDNVRAFLETP